MASAHCIDDLQLNITFNSDALARREQRRLAQWLSDELLPALDSLFSSLAHGQKSMCFERLEFDLGLLHGQDYQQQITQQLVEKFSALLRSRQLELPDVAVRFLSASASASASASQQRALEQLILFLRTGQLPWYNNSSTDSNNYRNSQGAELHNASNNSSKAMEGKYHQQLFAALLNQPALVEALRALPEREQLLERLVSQFPVTQLSALVKKFSPDFYQELVPVWQLLSKLSENGQLSYEHTALQQRWWKSVLRLWLTGDHQLPALAGAINQSRISWPTKLLQHLSRDLQLPTPGLYQQLLAASQKSSANSNSEFVRYLRAVQPAGSVNSPVQRASSATTVSEPTEVHRLTNQKTEQVSQSAIAWDPQQTSAARTTLARELSYQLAAIFNSTDSESLTLLWPELLVHHSELLHAALMHYVTIASIRQKLLVKFPLALLADIFTFLQPDWALALLYQSLVPQLARISGTDEDVERDLWEISFNRYFYKPVTARADFLTAIWPDVLYRRGLDPRSLVLAEDTGLTLAERQRLAEICADAPWSFAGSSENFSMPELAADKQAPSLAAALATEGQAATAESMATQDSTATAQQDVTHNTSSPADTANSLILALQKIMLRPLTKHERLTIAELSSLLLKGSTSAPLPTSARSLANVLASAELLPEQLLNKFFAQLWLQMPEHFFASLTQADWQQLISYGLRQTGRFDQAHAAEFLRLIKMSGADDVIQLSPLPEPINYPQLMRDLLGGHIFTLERYQALLTQLFKQQPDAQKINHGATQEVTREINQEITQKITQGFTEQVAEETIPGIQGQITPDNNKLPALAASSKEQSLVDMDSEAADAKALAQHFADVVQDSGLAQAAQNSDLRWQEFLRQLQRGDIALSDLQLSDHSGVQVIAHYLNQAGHIKAEYRQNLLASISTQSQRAPDKADYFRRVIYCLIYQQPLDFDEILASKEFWQVRAKQPDISRGNDLHNTAAITSSKLGITAAPKPALVQPLVVNPIIAPAKHEVVKDSATDIATADQALTKTLTKGVSTERVTKNLGTQDYVVAQNVVTQHNIASQGDDIAEHHSVDEIPAGNYDQEVWRLLRKIKNAEQASFALSVTQLQQLIAFYLAHSPELAAQYTVALASAIATQANKLQPSQRYHYYANLLQRLLAAVDIDVEDAHLLLPTTWAQEPRSDESAIAGVAADNNQPRHNAKSVFATEMQEQDVTTLTPGYSTHEKSLSATELNEPTQAPLFTAEQLHSLTKLLQTGAVQLDELQLSARQWPDLVDILVATNNSLTSAEKTTLLNQLSEQATADTELDDFYRQLVRAQLQAVALPLLGDDARGVDGEFMAEEYKTIAVAMTLESSSTNSLDNGEETEQPPVAFTELLMMAEADGDITSANSQHLWQLIELLKRGELSLAQLQASLPQASGLTKFFIANSPSLAADYRHYLQAAVTRYAMQSSNPYAFYLGVLQALLDGAELDLEALAAPLQPAPGASAQAQNVGQTKHSEQVQSAEQTQNTVQSQNTVQAQNTEQAQQPAPSQTVTQSNGENSEPQYRPLTIAKLLAVVEHESAGKIAEQNSAALQRLGNLIASGQVHLDQLQASLLQLRSLTKFFIASRAEFSPAYSAQLQADVEKFSAQAGDARRYFIAVLHSLVRATEMNPEKIAAATLASSQLQSSPKGLAQAKFAASSVDDARIAQQKITSAMQTTAEVNHGKPVLDVEAVKPQLSDDKSMLALLQLPSFSSAQSLVLQQLLQAQLKRGKAETIRLWLKGDLHDAQLVRLIAPVPDYVLHQLLNLAYAAAYQLIYPLVKQVLDALAIAAPNVAAAAVHNEKWLFVFQQVLRSGNTKPEQKVLLSFARQLAKACGIADSAAIEQLVQERFALHNSTAKPALDKKNNKPAAEELLQEALQEGIHISNAGQVLAAPYFGRLFAMLQLTEQGQFVSLAAKDRAAHLLEYMVTGNSAAPEYDLLLNKVLCGISTSIPISAGIEVTEQEKTIIEQLLSSIIQHWKVLGSTSIDGLRQTFLRRQGWLYLDEDGWRLRVQPGTFDMLLDQLPWSIALVKSGWMDQPLRVSWRE